MRLKNIQSQKKETEWVANEEPASMKPSIEELTLIEGSTTLYSMNGIEANARIRVEQDVDLVLKKLKPNNYGQPHDKVLSTTDRRFEHYKAIEDRIIVKDRLFFRKYYGETGNVKYYQNLLPKQLVDEVRQSFPENLASIPELPKRKLYTDKLTIIQTRRS